MATKEDAGVGVDDQRAAILSGVVQSVARACENENWGQVVEAAEDYQSACYKLKHAALPEVTCFSQDEKTVFSRISTALYQKYTKLSSVEDLDSYGIDGKKLCSALENFEKDKLSLSSLNSTLSELLPLASSEGQDRGEGSGYAMAAAESERRNLQTFMDLSEDEYETALQKAMESKAGSLLKRKDVLPGYSYLDINIMRIGLKDPQNYIDPFITVSVKSLKAKNIEQCQDTPVVIEKDTAAVVFNVTVQIQNPLEEIPGGSAIFFEFKHFKPKKSITSTKCFSFMEMDEIKPGKIYLEIYKKPTDFRRKKLSLLSAKPLYLHLNLTLNKP